VCTAGTGGRSTDLEGRGSDADTDAVERLVGGVVCGAAEAYVVVDMVSVEWRKRLREKVVGKKGLCW
jgi:hypothetical protein